ncbi:MAG: HlyD family efflux transporter periplasmic adaptor subunit [Candidatus Pseudomonas phytovorans]|uniref:HlyD family efflux transporter periplasmic adaptor subunit n=1 Tax=Candidatus Pseudomonas phytovorans TaxID=3121377 RepID=A0AAJ5WDZ9_9PSED|nr:HlyD family efflux transporter periplasmic adaptor subunit [Pseudomonas sp.]WEK29050.1 MAG: HlyD family efflux transporter periplasmic adaptor subunit [Pseudomonas sp.]
MNTVLNDSALAGLVQLERQARAADSIAALGFVMVNETRHLLNYRQAMLWDTRAQRLASLSGLATVEQDAPFNHWLGGLCQAWQQAHPGPQAVSLNATALPHDDQAQWAQYLPPWVVWLPLYDRRQHLLGALLLARDQALSAADSSLLALLQDAYGHAWASFERPRLGRLAGLRRNRRYWLAAAAILAGLALLPVRQAALAPAEIVALQPSVLRAPLQGVVERILVEPNQSVKAGQALVQLDARELQSRLESSRQALAIAEGELRQGQQQALNDARSKAGLAVLQGRRDQALADVGFLQQSLARTHMVAPHDGVALYDDPAEWQGRPVTLGEQILQVADPHRAQLEVRLPVKDAIELRSGAEVLMFLNTDPASPLPAHLQQLGYRASANGDGSMAYRLKATLGADDPRIRIGLKGTAKVYGERTTLFTYLLRRPLATLRIWLAL